ncbi:g5893 [Coccomyxa viridis]|uniref:RNA helicase n=1 Tax=Coccomyxa viridis TaxID=1274662 RepID=A0ABP1FU23_9CHLO
MPEVISGTVTKASGDVTKRLPIAETRNELLQLIRAHDTTILVGETGSGKSTQLPQFLLQAGMARGGCIAVTQPRRVAAISVARRVAQEMGVKLGSEVGYNVRFDDTSCPDTRIRYLTDGMLVREALVDPDLKRYKVIILDEAHERTLSTDILFAIVKHLQVRRQKDLKVIVMSATLDAAKFADFFRAGKIVHIVGRQHPVQVLYLPEPVDSYLDAVLKAVLQIHAQQPAGDILAFLTGQEEIDTLQRLIPERAGQMSGLDGPEKLVIVPIFAALPPEQQARVFEDAPAGSRKVILATNIAETSITVPGVRYVVDPGFVKARSYSSRTGADSLQVVPISKAQARQRSGRAGREGPGVAFRLYKEETFQSLPAATVPEIQRVSLTSLMLQLKQLNVQQPQNFDFMDKPSTSAMLRALELLLALGALDSEGTLTSLGRQMVRLPIEPVFAKVLLSGAELGCSQEALTIVAAASTDPIFFTPRNKQDSAAQAWKPFFSSTGDHITKLNVFKSFLEVRKPDRRRWCAERMLNFRSLKKAVDIRAQLAQHLKQLKVPMVSCGSDTAPIQRALLSGLFINAAILLPDNTYRLQASSQTVSIHPSSVLHGRKPRCIVFDELLRTTRRYARNVTAVEPSWLPEAAPMYFHGKTGNV